MRRLVSLLKPPAWVWMKGERDSGFEKCASSKPALTWNQIVAELAGSQHVLPARAARRAVVVGPTHARRGARATIGRVASWFAVAFLTVTGGLTSFGVRVSM